VPEPARHAAQQLAQLGNVIGRNSHWQGIVKI
jgi:hypothetical protein